MPIPLVIAGVALTATEVSALLGLTAATAATAVVVSSPEYQRNAQAAGAAIQDGISGLFTRHDEQTQTRATTTTTTNTTTRECDGPHRGRLQSQGYRRPDPGRVELSQAWSRPCIPPLRAEGRAMISALLNDTRQFSFVSAGIRARAFARMSRHINSAPPTGFVAGHRIGWGITPHGALVRNIDAGLNAPRVDLEVWAGRAFGDR